ncbi:MAG: hypothetical protein ACXV5R_03710, partial [Candidatus Angelobacter sp.]
MKPISTEGLVGNPGESAKYETNAAMDAHEPEASTNMRDAAKSNPIYGRKLRLAIFGGRGIPSTYSGTETFFIELAPRLVERGHDVIVYCRKALFKER